MSHKNSSWHHPKSYSEIGQVLETGSHFYTTPHGLRGEMFRAPVCGTDDTEADLMLHGWRDDFSSKALQSIRETQHRRRSAYMGGEGRTEHLPADISYAVAYKGQLMGYVTVGREVRMNQTMERSDRATKNAWMVVFSGLLKLAENERSFHFRTEGD